MRNAQAGKIRIIGGEWRGRKLPVIDADGLRPTTDRTRETLFNWLQDYVYGADCLDLYAGTGSLSFEALSRGAASVCMIEQNGALSDHLQQNKKTLKAEAATIIKANASQWLADNHKQFDLIFLDPPFHQNLIETTLHSIRENKVLKEEGLLYIETEANYDLPQYVSMHKQKTTAQVQYGLYRLID